jgi:hypothetical protein
MDEISMDKIDRPTDNCWAARAGTAVRHLNQGAAMTTRMAAVAVLALLGATAGALLTGAGRSPAQAAVRPPDPDTVIVHIAASSMEAAVRSLERSTSAEDIARLPPTGDSARYQFVVLSRRVTAGTYTLGVGGYKTGGYRVIVRPA